MPTVVSASSDLDDPQTLIECSIIAMIRLPRLQLRFIDPFGMPLLNNGPIWSAGLELLELAAAGAGGIRA